MAQKKVDGKKKSKDVDSKKDDEEKSSSRVLRSGNATKGKGKADEKAKGKKPMMRTGGIVIHDVAEEGENAGKRKAREKRDRIVGTKEKGKGKLVEEEGKAKKAQIQVTRRTADQEIGESSMSSANKSPYNLRARKAILSFQGVGLSENGFVHVVGKRVKVFKSELRKWITGQIKSYNQRKKLHKVLYDDDDESEEADLQTQRFEVELMPGEASTLCLKHKPK
ncbi:hypothetical protein ACSBR1_034706 [Camellia fascicularis]